jgi:hypothetical protein
MCPPLSTVRGVVFDGNLRSEAEGGGSRLGLGWSVGLRLALIGQHDRGQARPLARSGARTARSAARRPAARRRRALIS